MNPGPWAAGDAAALEAASVAQAPGFIYLFYFFLFLLEHLGRRSSRLTELGMDQTRGREHLAVMEFLLQL